MLSAFLIILGFSLTGGAIVTIVSYAHYRKLAAKHHQVVRHDPSTAIVVKQTLDAAVTARPAPAMRDVRIDFFRGLALLFIFLDHLPGSVLSEFTMRSFGFSDASEVFILIAGYSAYAAYSGVFAGSGAVPGLRVIGRRIRDLYAAQLLLVAICTFAFVVAARVFENPLYFEFADLTPFAYDPLRAIVSAITLSYHLAFLSLLPLYIFLLAWFIIFIRMLKFNWVFALVISALIWLSANLFGINLPGWPTDYGWYFNPFAWQLLFSVGAAAAHLRRQGVTLPYNQTLLSLVSLYLCFALLHAAPWANWLGLPHLRLTPVDLLGISKSYLSPWRLAHVLALAYVLALLTTPSSALFRNRASEFVIMCGRNSLDIYCLATLLSIVGFVALLELGRSWPYQVTVNGLGLAIILWAARWLTHRQDRRRAAREGEVPVASSAFSAPTDAAFALTLLDRLKWGSAR